MRTPTLIALVILVGTTSACSFQNKYEKQAQKITQAIAANDLSPVKDEIPAGQAISRVQVAEWSSELAEYGKFKSLKENPTGCAPSYHCFDAQFEKRLVREQMMIDDKDKVAQFKFHAVDPTPAPTK